MYAIAVIVIILIYIGCAFSHLWVWDFWIHAAIVRELIERPFDPQNPIFQDYAIYITYYPYCLLTAATAKLLSLAPQEVLAYMGVLNLVLLFVGLLCFTKKFSKERFAPLLALLSILFLWGETPWDWSNFYHWNVLFYNASYSSIFAFGLSLIALSYLDYLLVFVPIMALVLLTHPITFIFPFIVSLTRLRTGLVIGYLLIFLLAWVWPYFPLSQLLIEGRYLSDPNAELLYKNVLQRVWPALLGVPFLIHRVMRDKGDILFWSVCGFLLIYLFGYFSSNWNYGRVISYVVFLSQLSLALWLAPYVRKSTALVALCVFLVFASLKGLALREIDRNQSLYSKLTPVAAQLDDSAIVMASPEDSLALPSFGAKIFLANYPSVFYKDYEERKKFFEERNFAFLKEHYGVTHVLLRIDSQDLLPPPEISSRVYTDQNYLLFALK